MSAINHPHGRSPRHSSPPALHRTKVSHNPVGVLLFGTVRLIRVLFTGHIRFKRQGSEVHVLLEEKKPAAADGAESAQDQNTRAALAELAQITKELSHTLDHHFRARTTLRHLSAFEQALKAKGVTAFDELTSDSIARISHQLEVLCVGRSSRALSTLRSWLTIAAMDHEQASDADEPDTQSGRHAKAGPPTLSMISDFNDSARIQVEEVGESLFLEADRNWNKG